MSETVSHSDGDNNLVGIVDSASNIVNFFRLNRDVCEALGLDPAKVEEITITFKPRDVSVEVRYLSTLVHGIPAVMKRYSLVERE